MKTGAPLANLAGILFKSSIVAGTALVRTQLDRMPDAMAVRRQTVEHPFGTLKAWIGATHFLTRTLDKVRTEMSLQVLAYNLKRKITIFGVGPLMAAIRT